MQHAVPCRLGEKSRCVRSSTILCHNACLRDVLQADSLRRQSFPRMEELLKYVGAPKSICAPACSA